MSMGNARGQSTFRSIRGHATAAAAIAAMLVAGNGLSTAAARADAYAGDDSYTASTSSKGPSVDLDVVNANLLAVVRALRMQSKAQIVVVSGDYQPVTLTITSPLTDALRYVAQSAGATVSRDANGVYTFRPAGSADAQQDVQPVMAASVAETPKAPAAATHWEKIVLQNVDPNFVLNMLNDPTGYRNSDPGANPINQTNLPAVAPVMAGAPSVVLQDTGGRGQPQNGSTVQSSVPMAGGQFGMNPANQANRTATDASQQANQFPGGFQPGGGGGFNPFQPGGGGAAPGGLPATGAGQGANLRPQGIDSIIANEQDNALIVRGTAEGIAELKQIINFLDRAPKQVQIKIEFVTATVADVDTFGIQWDLIPAPNIEVGFNGPGLSGTQGSTFLTFAQGNLVTRLEALLTTSRGKVISAPIITTTNNTPGSIDFSQQIPYQTSTTVAQGSGNAVSSTSVNFLNVTNNFTVTPRVNGDNSVSLFLTPTLTSVGSPSFTGGPPALSRQRIQTYRTVANGETMVLGGLVSKTETNASERVPFLSQLPIIGSLFRTRNLNISNTELLVFVTPTVLPPIGSNSSTVSSSGGGTTGGSVGVAVGVTP